MRTKQAAGFFILLLFWAQVDNLWAVSPIPQSRACVEDDDEYLSTPSLQTSQQSFWRQGSLHATLTPSAFNLAAAPSITGERTDDNSAGPFGPSCLYIFMSLQR